MVATLLYNTLLLLAYAIFRLVALFSGRARSFLKSRQQGLASLQQWLASYAADAPRPLWLHAASVGELDQALAVAREFSRKAPEHPVIISVFSLSARTASQPGIALVFYMPLDLPWRWSALVRRMRPLAFVTMTWDLFPNLLRAMKAQRRPAFLASAALNADNWRLRPTMRPLFRPFYAGFQKIHAVNEQHAAHFRLLTDAARVQVSGDARYDQVLFKIENASLKRDLEQTLRWLARGTPPWILASTYAPCEERILPGLPDLLERHRRFQVWIFPHKVDEPRLAEISLRLEQLHIPYQSLSALLQGRRPPRKPRVVLMDRLGLLAAAYRFACFCYVGGGFHQRVHNTAEPAACAIPVLSGPRIDYSPIAQDLARAGALLACDDGHQLLQAAERWMKQPREAKLAGARGKAFLEAERGSAARFVTAELQPLLPGRPSATAGKRRL